MDKSPALPHAPSEPLPELDEFLKPFQALFRRRESPSAMERYLTGLLTEHPVKNCDTPAEIVPGTNEQQLQGLLTQMVWDETALNQRRVQIMRALKTEGDGVLIIDDTGFAQQGQHSVGVARQYSGTAPENRTPSIPVTSTTIAATAIAFRPAKRPTVGTSPS